MRYIALCLILALSYSIGNAQDPKCDYKKTDGVFFSSKGGTIRRDKIESIEKCAFECSNIQCKSANYFKTAKRCELLQVAYDPNDKLMMSYYGYSNPNAIYLTEISCIVSTVAPSTLASSTLPPSTLPPSTLPPSTVALSTKPQPTNPRFCGQTPNGDPMKKPSRQRIVGGANAKPHTIPWIVSLRQGFDEKRHFCGGTLINVGSDTESDIVITAAHCNEHGLEQDMVDLHFGAHDLTSESDGEEKRMFSGEIINHENFNFSSMEHDIAIVKLESPVKFTKNIQPACLPPKDEQLAENTPLLVAGWGHMTEGKNQATLLQQLDVPLITTKTCDTWYHAPEVHPPKQIFEKTMMCAGYAKGKQDACQGDSGGPLVSKSSDGHYELVGVVSFGKGCAREHRPGVYARVANYIDWIEKKIRELSAIPK